MWCPPWLHHVCWKSSWNVARSKAWQDVVLLYRHQEKREEATDSSLGRLRRWRRLSVFVRFFSLCIVLPNNKFAIFGANKPHSLTEDGAEFFDMERAINLLKENWHLYCCALLFYFTKMVYCSLCFPPSGIFLLSVLPLKENGKAIPGGQECAESVPVAAGLWLLDCQKFSEW